MEPSTSVHAYCPFGKRDYYPQIQVHHDPQIQEPPPVHRCHNHWLQSTTSSLLGPTFGDVAMFQTHTRLLVVLVAVFLLLLVLDGLMGSATQVPLTEADPEHLPDHRLAMHAGKAAIKEMHRQFVVFMDSHESL